MAERPVLRVIDGNGELDHTSAVLPADYANLEQELRKVLREKAALKAQLTKLRKTDPQAPVILDILAYWRNTLRGPASRVEVDLDGKRAEVVRRRVAALINADEDPGLAESDKDKRAVALQSATERAVERIKTAVDGCARIPFEGAYGKRYPEAGEGRKRKDDIVYILRDETTMERFTTVIEHDEHRLAYRAMLAQRLKTDPRLRDVLGSLTLAGECHGEILARCVRYCAAHPRG